MNSTKARTPFQLGILLLPAGQRRPRLGCWFAEASVELTPVPAAPGGVVRRAIAGVLTIFQSAPTSASPIAPLEAFRDLQRQLQLTPEKAEAWKAALREARR